MYILVIHMTLMRMRHNFFSSTMSEFIWNLFPQDDDSFSSLDEIPGLRGIKFLQGAFSKSSKHPFIALLGHGKYAKAGSVSHTCQYPVSPDLEGLPNLGDLPHLMLSFDLVKIPWLFPGAHWNSMRLPETSRVTLTGMVSAREDEGGKDYLQGRI